MFTATKPLPLTVPTTVGESATSFASRLARRNGVPRLITFCSDVGIDYFALVNGDPVEIQRLAVLGDIDPVPLQAATPSLIEPGWFQLGNERIKFTGFIRTTLRICPMCISEARNTTEIVHHGVWQLAAIRTCVKHGCHLVAVPKPKNANDCFDHVSMLDEFQPTIAGFALPEDLQLERYLTDRIQSGPGQTWLDRLPFHIAAQTCEMFGALLTLGPQAKRAELTDAQWGAAGTAGLKILCAGPNGLRKKLKELQNSHPVGEKLYRSHYRVFFDWLRSRNDDEDFDVVRDVVREFIFENFPVTTGSIVLGKPCPEQLVHSFATAAQVFGVPHIRLGRKLANLGMAKLASSGKFYVLARYIPTALLNDICTELNEIFGAKEAARSIGIDYVLLERMASEGLVMRYFEDGQATSYYHQHDIAKFIKRLRALSSRPEDGMETIDIATAARRRGIMIAPLTALILKHRIPLFTADLNPTSFRAFRLRLESLRNLRGRQREVIVASTVVARTLKINRQTVYHLQEAGFLQSPIHLKNVNVRNGHYSTKDSLDEFKISHVSLEELAEASGRSPNEEYLFQAKRGVTPIPLGLRCSMVFRRCDVA